MAVTLKRIDLVVLFVADLERAGHLDVVRELIDGRRWLVLTE